MATQRPIADLVVARLGNTLFLALYAAAMSVPLSLLLGVLAALLRNSVFDRVSNAGALTSISFPEFFVAYILILLAVAEAATSRRWCGSPRHHLWRPALLLLSAGADPDACRHGAYDADDAGRDHQPAGQPLYRDGAAEGLSPLRVVLRHALPNALAPIINVIALNLAYLITGVVVVEVVFVYPGLGS